MCDIGDDDASSDDDDKERLAWLKQSGGVDGVAEMAKLWGREAFASGDMGDCVTVAVFWNWNASRNRYENGNAHHAAGGASALAWSDLLEDVPADARIVGAVGSDPGGFVRSAISEALKEKKRELSDFQVAAFVVIRADGVIEPYPGSFDPEFKTKWCE